jgi:hypothetical protein
MAEKRKKEKIPLCVTRDFAHGGVSSLKAMLRMALELSIYEPYIVIFLVVRRLCNDTFHSSLNSVE